MKTSNYNSNKKLNKKRFADEDQKENNIIIYKKDLFSINDNLSTGESLYLNKLPIFSSMPYSVYDESDFEYNDFFNDKTKTDLNNIDNNESENSIKGKNIY